MQKQIIIAGPTASGKTSLSIRIAKELNAEIISVDSRQCYKYLDIGTAKPSAEELALVKHHNISIFEPDKQDSVADFKNRADRYTADIESRGKRVLFCGGSTLHLQSLIHPLDDIPSSNKENIEKLNKQADEKGIEELYKLLLKTDPKYAAKMDGKNRQRIIRALDVWQQTGKPFSSYHSEKPFHLPENMALFVLHHPRKVLHQRIEKRTDGMFTAGVVQETKRILEMGFSGSEQAMQTVGYKEILEFLDGRITEQKMIENAKTSTRRYAKRQITWYRRWPFATILDMSTLSEGEAVARVTDALGSD
ncbi:MAG: tRNA (adenosine(37)-N6)-dimethylallyltransferase MiaA [Balneolaceae bacterium]|nr:MAG: tRNA (adenosine(37)-N6)-dimethylallyltransferase MiaA [Balneolaceae bacterium]